MDRIETKSVRRKIRRSVTPLPGAVRGLLTGFAESGQPLVDFPANPEAQPVLAISLVDLKTTDKGGEVVLVFEDSDPGRPIIVGCVKSPVQQNILDQVNVKLDGRQVTLSAENEIVLRCGESSITLTRAGKVLIRGTYLLSRSTGANRIQGGSVQLN